MANDSSFWFDDDDDMTKYRFMLLVICVDLQPYEVKYQKPIVCFGGAIWSPGIILGMGSANGRRHYYVMPSFIGRAHTQSDP